MPRLETKDGTELFYIDIGSGDPLVFVHGGFLNHRVWDYQVEALVTDHRVVAVDLRGHGESGKPAVDYSAKLFATDLHRTITQLDLNGGTLVGWSLGATVVTAYMGLFGTGIERAILSSSGIFEGIASRAKETNATNGLDFERLLTEYRDRYPEAMREFVTGLFAKSPSDEQRRWLWNIGMQCPLHVAIAILEMYADMDYDQIYKWIKRVEIPVAVFHGASDAAATLADAEYVANEVLNDGTFVPFHDSAHLPFLEQHSRFNEKLNAFAGTV